MARKTKGQLPSGNIRVQVYDYTDENGKKHYKSFTGRTKTEAHAMANEWKANKELGEKNKTISDVVEEFISINESRLSPTTYKTYKGYIRYFKESFIGKVGLFDLTNAHVQKFVNDLAIQVAPKTVKNVYLLLKPSVELQRDNFRFKVILPEIIKKEKHIPSADDIAKVIESCNDHEMVLAIKICLFGMMRRGEVAALTMDDINFRKKQIVIDKAYALTADNTWVLKSTKTHASIRTVDVDDDLLEEIKEYGHKTGTLIGLTPSKISGRFEDTVKRAGIEPFTFHALRHFAESTASALNIPSVYIESIGGWEHGSDVRTRNYDHVIDIDQVRYNKLFVDRISSILGNVSHEVSHG